MLGDRYGVGSGQARGRTFSGRPVWEDALHFVAPGRHDLNYFTVLALIGVVALLVRRAYRTLAFCALTVAAPVALLLVRAGERRLGAVLRPLHDPGHAGVPHRRRCRLCSRSHAGPAGRRLVVLVLLVAGLLADRDPLRRAPPGRRAQDRRRRGHARRGARARGVGALRLDGHVGRALLVVRLRPPGEHPRPPRRASRVLGPTGRRRLVRCGSKPFLRRAVRPRYGVWVFYAASRARGERGASARSASSRSRATTSSCGRRRRLEPRALIREGLALRERWKRAVPFNHRVDELLAERPAAAGGHLRAVRRAGRSGHLAALAARAQRAPVARRLSWVRPTR